MLLRYIFIVSVLALSISCGDSSTTLSTSSATVTNDDPVLALTIVVGDGSATLSWGSSSSSRINAVEDNCSYTVFVASDSGLTINNWSTLPDGAKHENVVSPFLISGLNNNMTYFFILARSCGGTITSIGSVFSATPTELSDTVDASGSDGTTDGWAGIYSEPVF